MILDSGVLSVDRHAGVELEITEDGSHIGPSVPVHERHVFKIGHGHDGGCEPSIFGDWDLRQHTDFEILVGVLGAKLRVQELGKGEFFHLSLAGIGDFAEDRSSRSYVGITSYDNYDTRHDSGKPFKWLVIVHGHTSLSKTRQTLVII